MTNAAMLSRQCCLQQTRGDAAVAKQSQLGRHDNVTSLNRLIIIIIIRGLTWSK